MQEKNQRKILLISCFGNLRRRRTFMAITMEWRKTGMAYWMFSYVKEIFRRWNWHSRRWRDLIFPHHENEIAQSEAANGCEFSKYWMHNGFLNINNKKMSKSLGNFFTVRDISEKYDLQVLNSLCLVHTTEARLTLAMPYGISKERTWKNNHIRSKN